MATFYKILKGVQNICQYSKLIFCLFVCLLQWDLPDCAFPGCVFGTIRKLFARRGAQALFCDIWIYKKILIFKKFISKKIFKKYFCFYFGYSNGKGHISPFIYLLDICFVCYIEVTSYLFLCCGSLQRERLFSLSACILKHINIILVVFLVNDHLQRVVANGHFLFFYLLIFYYFFLIKTLGYVFSWDLAPFEFSYLENFSMQFLPWVPSF